MTEEYSAVEVELLFGSTPKFGSKHKGKKDDRPSAREVLAELAMDKCMDEAGRSRLINGKTRALVVEVPESTWVHPILDAIEGFVENKPYKLPRTVAPKAHDRGEPRLADALTSGRQVIAAAKEPDFWLPELLMSVADARVKVLPADAEMVIETIKRAQGGRVPARAKDLRVEVLTFEEICSLIVADGSASETVDRLEIVIENKLRRDKKPKKNLPKLVDAIEYGAAREWALDLRADIADAKAGKIGWDQVDKGCVLHGPPGTGKTLLAQMLAEACDVPVVVASVGEFFASTSGYLDSVIKAMRKVFDEAKNQAPSILFLDEINSLPNADTISERGRDWWLPVITDFYTLLDSAVSDREGVIVVGATNRLQDINPAILRPGRLERAIHVGPPDEKGVERIMRHHLGDDLAGTDIRHVAKLDAMLHATGAVIMEQVRAARRRARRAGRSMELDDLLGQVAQEDTRDEATILRTAAHEAGHVLMGLITGAPVESATIIPFGDAGGGTQFSKQSEAHFMTRRDFENKVMVLLGGRAAEEVMLDAPSQGAGGAEYSDLGKATMMLASMFVSLGLGDSLLYRTTAENAVSLMAVDRAVELKVHNAMSDLYDRTLALLEKRKPTLAAITQSLLDNRFIDRAEIESVVAKTSPPGVPLAIGAGSETEQSGTGCGNAATA